MSGYVVSGGDSVPSIVIVLLGDSRLVVVFVSVSKGSKGVGGRSSARLGGLGLGGSQSNGKLGVHGIATLVLSANVALLRQVSVGVLSQRNVRLGDILYINGDLHGLSFLGLLTEPSESIWVVTE